VFEFWAWFKKDLEMRRGKMGPYQPKEKALVVVNCLREANSDNERPLKLRGYILSTSFGQFSMLEL